jgi:hypothetical protein
MVAAGLGVVTTALLTASQFNYSRSRSIHASTARAIIRANASQGHDPINGQSARNVLLTAPDQPG